MDKFEEMLAKQEELQIKAYGGSPALLDGEERIQFIKDMILALEDELHEALGEVGWKPWATSRHIHPAAFKGELVDAFHFFMNLMLVVGMDTDELYRLYMAKREKNQARQAVGYDGLTGKCPGCRRALDDEAVTCTEDHCSEA